MQKPVSENDEHYISFILEHIGSNYESNSLCLHMTNNTKQRIEGYLVIDAPVGWKISPDNNLIIAVKPDGTISIEFDVITNQMLENEPILLKISIKTKTGKYINAEFDMKKVLNSKAKL